MTESSGQLRGRRGRERRFGSAGPGGASSGPGTIDATRPRTASRTTTAAERRGPADLSVLPVLLAETGALQALAERLSTAAGGVGRDRRHVTYGGDAARRQDLPCGGAVGRHRAAIGLDRPRRGDRRPGRGGAGRLARDPRRWSRWSRAPPWPTSDPSWSATRPRRGWLSSRLGMPATRASWSPASRRSFQRTLPVADLRERAARPPAGARAWPRSGSSVASWIWATSRSQRSPVAASSRDVAASSTASRQASRCRCAWNGSVTRSSRCGRSTPPTSAASVRSGPSRLAARRRVPLPVEAERGAQLFEARLGRIVTRLPERLATDLARLVETGSLGDAAEVWSGVLAPATGLDHVGDAILVIDEPADVGAAFEASCRPRPTNDRASWKRPASWPRAGPSAYLSPRGWKAALHAARTLELGWERETSTVRRRAAIRSAGTSRPCRPRAIGSIGATVARWRGEGARVVLASDQSARLAELLTESDIVAAPVQRLDASRRRAASRSHAQPERRLCRRTGRPRRRHRP